MDLFTFIVEFVNFYELCDSPQFACAEFLIQLIDMVDTRCIGKNTLITAQMTLLLFSFFIK